MKKRKLELKKEVIVTLNQSTMAELRGGVGIEPFTDDCPSQGIKLCKTNTCGDTDLCKLAKLCAVKTDPSICYACIPATEYKCESVQVCIM